MTTQEERDLKEIASRLPKGIVQNPVYEKVGSHVRLAKGETSDVGINHYRRLKRAYNRNGMEGVKHYLNQVHNQIKKNKEIAGLSNPEG